MEAEEIAFFHNLRKRFSNRAVAYGIDQHIGARLRQQRVLNGLTAQDMAELIGVTRKQTRKYENGVNRIPAGRLYAIAQALGVEVGHFFKPLVSAPPSEHDSRERVFREFAYNFRRIRKRKHQEAICLMTRILAAAENGHDTDA